MNAVFHSGWKDSLLFPSLVPNNFGQYFAALIVIFFMSTIQQTLSDYINHQMRSPNSSKYHEPVLSSIWNREKFHLYKALLQTLNSFLHYSLFLIAVTMNAGNVLFIMVIDVILRVLLCDSFRCILWIFYLSYLNLMNKKI